MRVGTRCVVTAWMLGGLALERPAAAQESVIAPVPLVQAGEQPAGLGHALVQEVAARRALEAGLPAVAAALYAELMADATLPPAAKQQVLLGWSMALVETGRATEARAALAAFPGEPDARLRLRQGLAAIAEGDAAAARAAADAIAVEELPPLERSWLHYLRGAVADAEGAHAEAVAAYALAIEEAGSSLQRARFELAERRSSLRVRPATEAEAQRLARAVEQTQGSLHYSNAKLYASVLAQLGRTDEAVAFLQRQLIGLPPQERGVQDDFRLLLGLIAGAADGVGRTALLNLVATGSSPEQQRVALQLLAQATTTPAAREAWRAELTRLIRLEPPHAVIPDLLYYRAILRLADDRYEDAEQDARELIERFPASPLRPAGLGVLIASAWERLRFRAVAGYAAEARRLLPAGEARARLGVLTAEAFFRAEDFTNAADAYAASLNEVPGGVTAGSLMFQEILSHIRAGQLERAAQRLDELAGQRAFDAVNRWQAEYNLARALQLAGRTREAHSRIDLLMTAGPGQGELPADLVVRLDWLRARLALEAGEPSRALELAATPPARLADVPADLRAEVGGLLALVEAEANFALQRPEAALAALQRVRAEHPGSDAATYSYLVEAQSYSDRNQLVEAQRMFTRLADDLPESQYAPYALYQAALNAERRGQDSYLADAIRLIERLVNEYPQSEFVFYARFKQADLLRKLNLFAPAVQIYEQLVNDYPGHADIFAAELARADSYANLAAGDASQLESALIIYERLMVLPVASIELRAEAAYKRGHALLRRNHPDRAQAVWWEAINTFLLGEDRSLRLGVRGRYWLARSLLELARVAEGAARLDEARRLYQLMLQQELPGANLARAALTRLSGAGTEAGR